MRSLFVLFLALLLAAGSSAAQDVGGINSTARPAPIQDNSFLIEEAYNQEDGVIQHISTFERLTSSHDWVYTQRDEWPVRSLKHQLSVTLSGAHSGDFAGSGAGWGDSAFNYRYQLAGSGETKLAVAPRLSVLLPTGNPAFGRGSGALGFQTNLPVSIQHSAHLVTHWNAGATWVPHAVDSSRDAARTIGVNLGQSVVWLVKPRVNFLLETLWTSNESVVGPDRTLRSQDLYVSPGIRWAYNLKGDLQIVPGIATPVGIGPSAETRASCSISASSIHLCWHTREHDRDLSRSTVRAARTARPIDRTGN